jgi:drug/metabolite transporter (DMT)-like permease
MRGTGIGEVADEAVFATKLYMAGAGSTVNQDRTDGRLEGVTHLKLFERKFFHEFFAGLPCIPFLLFVPLPAPASWPFLALSLAVHGVYYVTLINAYRFGALSQVYPIARGAAPLMIALGAWAFAGEAMSALEWAGVIVASAGIMSLAAPGKLPREEELKAIGFALATSITIALYSLADGMGVRRAGESMSYILWLLAIDAFPVMIVGLWLRRGRVVETFRPHLKWAIVGGLLSALGYGIVIWAMGKAPLAHVSALRETSVILAAVIGTPCSANPSAPPHPGRRAGGGGNACCISAG